MQALSAQPTTAPRRRVPFYGLLLANGISGAGNLVEAVALPWFVLELTESATAAGLTGAAAVAPSILAGVFGGTLVDRLGYRRSAVVSDLVSGIAVLTVPLLALSYGIALWQMVLLVFASRLLDSAGRTARESITPELAELAQMPLARANGLYAAVTRATALVGAPLGGVLIAVFGAREALLVNGVSFFISAALLQFLIPKVAAQSGETPVERYFRNLAEGFRFLLGDRVLFAMIVTVLVTNLIEAPTGVAIIVYGKEIWQSSVQLGIFLSVFAVGAVGGALAYGWTAEHIPRRLVFPVGFGGIALLSAGFAVQLPYGVLLALVALCGVGAGPVNPLIATVYQERVPAGMRGRVFGLRSAVAMAAAPLGVLLGGVVIERWGLTVLFGAQGALLVASIVWMLASPQFRALAAPQSQPTAGMPSQPNRSPAA